MDSLGFPTSLGGTAPWDAANLVRQGYNPNPCRVLGV